ncbi:hypothetical protein [Halobacterium yunchengense]|uniref:hypothetical protein n=1 Tax=Halobacterium yunchengense TaxID=3108497 RepID=UPI0030094191
MSIEELDYFITDTTKEELTVELDRLRDAGIINEYTHDPNRSEELPWKFYGPSESGIEALGTSNFLKGVPAARAIIQKTRTTEKINRHMNAPRPSLPSAVRTSLQYR